MKPLFRACITSVLACVAPLLTSTLAHAEPVIFLSGMGAKCMDAEGGNPREGTRVIGYACNGQTNQTFDFNRSGPIRMNGLCVDAKGGQGRPGDELVLWRCNGQANQNWQWSNGKLVGINGLCVDLEYGDKQWFGNQRAVLWSCNGQKNQAWYWGKLLPASRVSGAAVVQPGQKIDIRPMSMASIVAAGGGNIVAAGGGNIIAAGAGN
ncbi:MAG: hypothetical protein A3F78_09235 [Burkholderiales bacterium RIFCSPLOWO2_12_FULL_61_40]|nr:MAG: hypothetical protein A3F78_09235 [Burkholderiales bacterium RIFCSPLOWO2_12_FULL_61_40]